MIISRVTAPIITFLVLISLMLISTSALASKRVALVIGNSDYKASPLKNPVNDAKDIAELLKQIGFDVILKTDVSKRTLENATNDFYQKLKRADVGFFFYAGHGMQIDGMNYLIPMNVNVTNANDVKYEAVPAGRILGKMEDAGNKLNIVVLDACRNNPFRSYFRSGSQGLAFMDAPDGTIIAYATSPGSLAADGLGRNGLYTGKLLGNLKRSDLSVLQVFNQTGLDVRKTTNGKQTPWLSSSPLEPFYLAGGLSVSETASQEVIVRKDVGILEVNSEPSGAQVFIDGKMAGETPVEIGDMAPGSKTIRIEKNGYTTEEKQTTIRKEKRSVVRFDPAAKVNKGWLTISPNPKDAKVRILNISPRYRKDMALDPGKYHVEVSNNGYKTKNQWIELGAGNSLNVDISLIQDETQTRVDPVLSNNIDGLVAKTGIHRYANGDVFEGSLKKGKQHGMGVYKYSNGRQYEGDFVLGVKEGIGVFTYPDGSRYSGQFKKDRFSGEGAYFFQDGSQYKGEFVSGRFSGVGKLTYADGSYYSGKFKDDLPNGHGILTSADGSRYSGEFSMGRRNGFGKMIRKTGEIYQGEFRNDEFIH